MIGLDSFYFVEDGMGEFVCGGFVVYIVGVDFVVWLLVMGFF